MKKKYFIFLLLLLPKFIFCCGNTYHDNDFYKSKSKSKTSDNAVLKTIIDIYKSQKVVDVSQYFPSFDVVVLNFEKEVLQNLLLESPNNYTYKNDFALIELKIGDKQKAVQLFENLYLQQPTQYNIVANLGTAYELTSNNVKALEFINKALVLNPNSHFGSEWIHKGVLESKIQNNTNPFGLFGNQNKINFYKWYSNLKPSIETLQTQKNQLTFQLKERIAFVAAPDKVVANLLIDAGDIEFCLNNKKEANALYTKALQYDNTLINVVDTRKNFNALKLFYFKNKTTVIVFAIVLLGLFGYFLWRKKK